MLTEKAHKRTGLGLCSEILTGFAEAPYNKHVGQSVG